MPAVFRRRAEPRRAHPGPATTPHTRRPPDPAELLEPRRLLALNPVGPELAVSTHGGGEVLVAADADGDFVVAWHGPGQAGSGLDIYAQRYTAAGERVGGEFQVNTFSAGQQAFPAMAMDADGDFVIAWASHLQDGSADGVYAQRFTAAGARAGGEFRVNTFTSGGQLFPTAAMDADGDFVITWTSGGQDGSASGIYAQRYTRDGAPAGGEFRVNTFTSGHQRFSPVAMDADGDFVVIWTSTEQDGSGYGAYAQRYSAAGNPLGEEFRVNPTTADDQSAGSVAMDADGDFVIAWGSRVRGSEEIDLYARRYAAAGAPAGDEFRLHTNTAGMQLGGTLAMDADGDFVAAWSSYAPGSTYGDVYAQAYTAAGARSGNEFRVNTTTTGNQASPVVASDAGGDVVIAWHSSGGSGPGFGVAAQRYGTDIPSPPFAAGEFVYREGAPHRLRFAFSEDVRASLSAADVSVQRVGDGGGAVAVREPTYDATTKTATFALDGTGGNPGVLPNGNYRATLLAAGVTSAAGTPLPADLVIDFFVLAGDVNRDRAVNGTDFALLAGSFGKSGMTYEQGDLTGDGSVNGSDFAILAGNFGKTMPAPTPAATLKTLTTATPAPKAQAAATARRRIPAPAALTPRRLPRIPRTR